MKIKVMRILTDEHGATAVEYALMVALIAIVIFLAVTVLGLSTSNLFSDAVNKFPEVQ